MLGLSKICLLQGLLSCGCLPACPHKRCQKLVQLVLLLPSCSLCSIQMLEHHVGIDECVCVARLVCLRLQGLSRYEAMSRMTEPIAYKGFRKSGHAIFTSAPLERDVTIVGSPQVELWADSSDEDADLFVYLVDYEPATRVSRWRLPCSLGKPAAWTAACRGLGADGG